MKVHMFCTRLLCTLMARCYLSMATDSTFRHFTTETGKKFQTEGNMVSFKMSCRTKVQCAAQCAADGNCMAASFQDDGMCYLSNYHVNGPENGQTLTDTTGWSAMSKTVCPENWIKLGDMCYLFVRQGKSHTQATDNCIQEGGILAEPRTYDNHVALTNYIAQLQDGVRYYRIGLIRDEGNFVWQSDNTTPTYSAWNPGEPDGSANCGFYRTGLWDDHECSWLYISICQSNLI